MLRASLSQKKSSQYTQKDGEKHSLLRHLTIRRKYAPKHGFTRWDSDAWRNRYTPRNSTEKKLMYISCRNTRGGNKTTSPKKTCCCRKFKLLAFTSALARWKTRCHEGFKPPRHILAGSAATGATPDSAPCLLVTGRNQHSSHSPKGGQYHLSRWCRAHVVRRHSLIKSKGCDHYKRNVPVGFTAKAAIVKAKPDGDAVWRGKREYHHRLAEGDTLPRPGSSLPKEKTKQTALHAPKATCCYSDLPMET